MQLSPELLEQFQSAINSGQLTIGNPNARTGQRFSRFSDPRQLDDLTLPPTKDDPRPTFLWSAEKPRNDPRVHVTNEYPKLMWRSDTGHEITVLSAEAQAEKMRFGYVLTCPLATVLDPLEEMQKQFAMLSEEDQQAIKRATNEHRVETMVEALSKLDPTQLAAVFEIASQKRKKVS